MVTWFRHKLATLFMKLSHRADPFKHIRTIGCKHIEGGIVWYIQLGSFIYTMILDYDQSLELCNSVSGACYDKQSSN